MAEDQSTTMWGGLCSTKLSLDLFYKCKANSNGRLPWCKACRRIHKAKQRERNREAERARDRARVRDPEKMRAAQKRWRERNGRMQVERAKACRHAKAGHYAAVRKAWKLANIERLYSYSHTRRARKMQAGGEGWTAVDVAEVKRLQRSLCAICRDQLKARFHRDHIVPLKLGGVHNRRNLQLLCEPCNLSKGARHPLDYSRSLGLLL
jgi:5-methylcytosine-specific restriction endonuclease McrA